MLENIEKLGENDHYWFGVGQLGDRWAGFAVGHVKQDSGNFRLDLAASHESEPTDMMFLFPAISDEDGDFGMKSKEDCIKYTLATAQHPPAGYGGIARWFVDESLRVTDSSPFVCSACDTVHPGNCDEESGEF